jgi:hypothetical protein
MFDSTDGLCGENRRPKCQDRYAGRPTTPDPACGLSAAFQVQGLQRAGHGIETCGENDDVEIILLVTCADARFGDFFNPAVGFRIDQPDVVLVEGFVVVGV